MHENATASKAALIHMRVASSKVWKMITRQSAQLTKTPGSLQTGKGFKISKSVMPSVNGF